MKKETYMQSDLDKAVSDERTRILTQILKNKDNMSAEYKQLIKHVGGMLTTSMTIAYIRGLNDVFKLVAKGANDEEPVQQEV